MAQPLFLVVIFILLCYNKCMIFLDNASTTKPSEEILNKFIEYQKYYFNASSGYKVSVEESELIDNARKEILKCLGKVDGNFIFTASSSEANNIIINSLVNNNKKSEYIFSKIEHPSIFNIAEKIRQDGKIVHFVGVNKDGTINEEELLNLINENTRFVSLIHVCNETGAICNIKEIAKKIKEKNNKVFVHSDGVQAFGKIDVKLNDYIDAYTISSHKIHGLKGVAGFYFKNLSLLKTFIYGGGQEFNIRSGTINTPLILAFKDACVNAKNSQKDNYIKVEKLNSLVYNYLKQNKNISFNTCVEKSSPYILSFSVLGINAETIMNSLSEKDIFVGLGSACSTKHSGNRILKAMDRTKTEILGNIRVSFSELNTEIEIQEFLKELEKIINLLKEKLS